MAHMLVEAQTDKTEPHLEELLESVSIHEPKDIRRAACNLHDIAQRRGFRVALCADISSGKTMEDAEGNCVNADVFGWVKHSELWWKDPQYALHSPIPRACRYESEPFWCDASGFHVHPPNSFLDDIDLQNYFAALKGRYNALIVVPVHLPFGQVSANSFPAINPQADSFPESFAKYGHLLGALTRRIICGYVSLSRKSKHIPSDCGLSKREAECIRWASVGKTDEEIGEIISVCRSTVRYHISRAGEKLEAVNRTQTVFKATQLGYLGNSHG